MTVPIAAIPGDWYIANARPKHAKALAAHLESFGVAACVPLNKRGPVLPGYCFVAIESPDQWYLLRRAPRAYGTPQRINDRERFVRELQLLLDSLEMNPDLGLCANPTKGRRVEVVRGPYRGAEGVIEEEPKRSKGGVRVVIKMTEPKLNWPVEVDADDVELL